MPPWLWSCRPARHRLDPVGDERVRRWDPRPSSRGDPEFSEILWRLQGLGARPNTPDHANRWDRGPRRNPFGCGAAGPVHRERQLGEVRSPLRDRHSKVSPELFVFGRCGLAMPGLFGCLPAVHKFAEHRTRRYCPRVFRSTAKVAASQENCAASRRFFGMNQA